MSLRLRQLLIFVITFLFIGCSEPMLVANGIGGTGKTDEGIGGTGQVAQEGIGGTGQIAEGIGGTGRTLQEGIGGTGIVGTITKFGSIWVNKAHVRFDQDTPVTINQQPASSAAFKIGQLVSLMSDKQGKGFDARSIDIVYEVVGPIAAMWQSGVVVLGQKVVIDKSTLLFSHTKPIAKDQLVVGSFVRVSGYRKPSGEIIATRIDNGAYEEKVELIGPVKQTDSGYSIFNQPIRVDTLLADASDAIQPNTPRRVLVVGTFKDGIIQVDRVESDSIQAVIEAASDLIWEGFIEEWDDDFYLNGIEHDLDDAIEYLEDELFLLEESFDEDFEMDELDLDDLYEDIEVFEDDLDEYEEVEEFDDFGDFDDFDDDDDDDD